MGLFKKKCTYCEEQIEKGEEIFADVKVPEFKEKVKRAFCSQDHVELYKKYVIGTPARSSCPNCRE